MDRYMGEWFYATTLLLKIITQKHCSGLYSTDIEFYFLKQKSLFESPFGGLRGNVGTPSLEKPPIDFLFIIIELFSLSLTIQTL